MGKGRRGTAHFLTYLDVGIDHLPYVLKQILNKYLTAPTEIRTDA